MSHLSKTSFITTQLLRAGVARRLKFMVWGVTLMLGCFLPRLQFQFELETLFAQNKAYDFYQEHAKIFGFDNDYLNVLIIPKHTSIYDWGFLSDMRLVTNQLEQLSDVESVHSPLMLKKLIKGPSGVLAYPMLNDSTKLLSDSIYIANDPYLSKAVSKSSIFVISIHHRHFLDARASEEFMSEVATIISNIPYENYFVGRIPAEKEFLGFIKTDFSLFLTMSLVICAIVLWVICSSLRLVMYPFLISALSLIWTFGLMGLLGIPITILTSLLPPIVLFVSSSDTIHLISAFRTSKDSEKAINKVLAPTFLTSVTTAIGFLSLVFVPVTLIRDMGWIAALSVVFAFINTYALAPLFLQGIPEKERPGHNWNGVLNLSSNYPKAVLFTFFLISGYGLWASFQLKVDAYLLHDMPPEAKALKSFAMADHQLGGSKPYEIAVWPKDTTTTIWEPTVLAEMNKIVEYLENEYPVAHVQAPSNLMQYARYIRHGAYGVEEVSRQDQLLARRLERQAPVQLVSERGKKARITGSIKEYGSLNTNQRDQDLHRFMATEIDPEVLGYRITGTNHLIDQTHQLLAGAMAKSLAWAMLLVSVLFGTYFKSIKWAFIALIPNIVPLLITGLLLYLLEVPIQLSTSIIFVLVFGIVVDDTIHFLATFKRSPEGTTEEKLQYTMETSGRGMLNTTLTLVAGFCLFLFSGFGGTYYLGFFLCIALLTALITDWVLLPVILRKFN